VTFVGKHALIAHPLLGSGGIRAIDVEVAMTDGDDVLLTYHVRGGKLVLPDWATPIRENNLWQTTCFELFLKPRGLGGYFEFNFSPSTRWAAYAFDGYRSGGRDLVMPVVPHIEVIASEGGDSFCLEVDLDLSAVSNCALDVGLSAVIEQQDGTKSYWALRHPNPDKPDFHDPACFTLNLSPPPAA